MKLAYLLLEATPVVAPAGTGPLAGLSPLEQLLAVLLLSGLALGGWSVINLSSTLMKMQQLRLLDKYPREVIEEAGLSLLPPTKSWWQRLYEKLTDEVPLEQEGAILLDHSYDGVRELDNNLPPWWKGVFYLSIAFAPLYIWFNHFSDFGDSSTEAYAIEMEEAAAEIKSFLATQEDLVDESNVTLLADADALAKGGMIYGSKCSVCHGKAGEGGIGPNLTDAYWLHGGSVADVFKTIKHGVPEKGMIPWKAELRPREIQEVASFIMTLAGTNPPGAKAPQGEAFSGETSSK